MTELLILSPYRLLFSQMQTHDQTEQETFSFDKAIVNLQTKLHEVQMEKDVLSELR